MRPSMQRLGPLSIAPSQSSSKALQVSARGGPGTQAATVERVVHLGFEVRADLTLDDGREVWVQMTRGEAEALDLCDGARVYAVKARKGR